MWGMIGTVLLPMAFRMTQMVAFVLQMAQTKS
jgi:hypothetical protein